MKNLNACLASLNLGLPDDVRRLKEAGYYTEAIACIDTYLAEDWTKTQNQPVQPAGPLPENPTPRGVDAMQDALLAQREILRRLPLDYTVPEAQALELLQSLVRGFTPEEFRALDRAGAMDWRFVEGEKRYIRSFAETLLATHPELAARQIDPPQQHPSWERYEPEHEQMVRTGAVSADITLETSIGMSDEAFAAALAKAKAEGRDAVHVRAWLPLPAACLSQSDIELEEFTEEPTVIAPENAPQRTVCWEADLTENRSFGVQYSYRNTAVYTDPSDTPSAPEQPDFDTEEQPSHIVFTPYIKALAAQLTAGITDPMEKAKRIYDYVTLNVRYHYQPSYFIHESLPEHCARDRRGDCGIMSVTFITLCRAAGIPARWQSGLYVTPDEVGCHDWAMFYVAPKGWLYADCSFGASMARRGDETLRQHYFGNLDPDRMVANSVFAAPFTPPMLGFRADPCDNQTGEVEADGVGLYGDETVSSKELVQYIEE